ncbi:MAG TPA: NAD(P)H-hydrate dehydratase [Woeseiaceae bacterium]|nr:NAD(P)H-hydrate dehydratase [Woeseiaceae bacterium]
MNLPVEIYSVESVRRIDRTAIDKGGISGYALMTRAAQAALEETRRRFPKAKRWQIVCGPGNNGGDGYVLARLAGQQGIQVSVLAAQSPESLKGDARTACLDLAAEGGSVSDWSGALDADADLLIDAMFGSGLERDISGSQAGIVDAINAHAAPVVALDIPSGVHGDSGAVMGKAVVADLTVTFVGLKTGLFLGAARQCVGELAFAGLGIPEECRRDVPAELIRIEASLLQQALPPRKADAHKGDFGHLLLVGGNPGMPGAIRLAGMAALRSGAGRVTIATHASNIAPISAGCPELMFHAIDKADDLAPILGRVDTLGIGPGLGTGDWGRALLEPALAAGLPTVVDADALTVLAGLKLRKENWILTPHPGEAARLLSSTVAEVQGDRPKAARELQKRYGGIVVLKGAGTLVAGGVGPCRLCTAGNPGMAAAGMGDVLTGIIAALLAQHLPAETAAQCGVLLHAMAGDAAAARGQRGMLASDLLPELRTCVNP